MNSVVIYSPWYFPNYVGGGERLAQLTASGLRAIGTEVTIVTRGPQERRYEFDGVPVWVVPGVPPTRESVEREAVLAATFAQISPSVVHLVGSWGTASAAAAAREVGARVGVAGLDYGQFCDNHRLVRGNGSSCAGRVSAADCMSCSMEGGRSRDRLIAKAGQWTPRAVRSAVTRAGAAVLQRPIGGQIEWSVRFSEREAARRRAAETIDVFVAPTKFALKSTLPHLGPRVRAHVLMYPRTAVRPDAGSKQTPHDRLVVGFVGRCLPMKGLHVLLDAVDRLDGVVPVELRLAVATNDGEEASYWKPLKARAARMPHVHWNEPGPLDTAMLHELHEQIDVMAVPSLWPEYVGFVALEALALGTPVVLSDYATQREILDERSGTIVPAGDEAALADALKKYWCAKQIGSVERPTCSAPSPSEYGRRLWEIYRELKR